MPSPTTATLLDVLIDGFEKNEILGGFHWRVLPLPDEATARERFDAFLDEARRWKGEPDHMDADPQRDGARRHAAWPDLEIRQAGRGVMVLAGRTDFHRWWNDATTWAGNPLAELYDWLADDRPGSS